MPDSPAPFDFGYPAAPGGNFPGILGDPGEELTPDAGLGGGTAAASGGQAFPIGSIYLSVLDTSPSVTLGYGTWSAYAQGRVLVGDDGASFSGGDTGGAVSAAVSPHPFSGQHNHGWSGSFNTSGPSATVTVNSGGGANPAQSQHTHSGSVSGSTNYDSGIQLPVHSPVSTLQPYLVVYIWVRTA